MCLKGKVKIVLKNKFMEKTIILNSNFKKGLFVEPKTWNILKPMTKKCESFMFV